MPNSPDPWPLTPDPSSNVCVLTVLLMFGAAGAAWGGLGWLLMNVPPSRPLAVVAAYVFAFAAITSTASLLAWVTLRPRRSPASYLAHSMLLAIIVLFAIWLHMLRTLTPIALGLLIGLYACMELAVLFGTRGSVEIPARR